MTPKKKLGVKGRLAAFFRGIRGPAVVVRKRSSAVVRQATSGSFGCAQDDSVELKWSEEGRSRFLDRLLNQFGKRGEQARMGQAVGVGLEDE
jgi:hypothetical protein